MKFSFYLIVLFCLLSKTTMAQTPSIMEQQVEAEDIFELTSDELQKITSGPKIQTFNEETESIPTEISEAMKSEMGAYLLLYKNKLREVRIELEAEQKEVLSPKYSKTEIDSIVALIETLQVKKTKLKSLITKIFNGQNTLNRLFPTLRNGENYYNSFYKSLYNKDRDDNLYLVNNTSYQFNQGGIIRSELLSAYLKGIRISLGTVVTTQNQNDEETADEESAESQVALSTDETEAFKRLTAGGSTYLDLEIPVTLAQGESWTIYWNLNTRMSYNIEGFSSDLKNSLFNGSVGTRFYSSISSDNKEFVFYATVSGGFYFGEEIFYNSLSIPTKGFLFGQVQLGVSVLQNLKLTFDINTFSSEDSLRSGRVVLGAQLLTDFFKK